MAALSRCVASLAFLFAGADGFRKRVAPDLQNASTSLAQRRQRASNSIKIIAGVPVFNYHKVHDGFSSLSQIEDETEKEWNLIVSMSTTAEEITAMCDANPNHGCNSEGTPNKGGVPFLQMTGTEADMEKVVQASNGKVRFFEPDTQMQLIPEFAAPLETATWGLQKIGAHNAGKTGAGVTVFIVDTGVRVGHEEFGGRAVTALDLTVGGIKECKGDLTCAADRQGHGTHCGGTAAGKTYGVAPGATVKSIKVLSDSGFGAWSWTYSALDWIAQNPSRPSVASMSLGESGVQNALKEAVDSVVNMGVVVVVAAGNSNSDSCSFSPAYVPSAFTVGSITDTDARSWFSNYGACTNIWAPGSNIVSASHSSDTATASMSGTSMACPHVSGAAALFLEANPFLLPWTIQSEILANAAEGFVSGLLSGDVNAQLYVGDEGPPVLAAAPVKKNCPWYTFGLC